VTNPGTLQVRSGSGDCRIMFMWTSVRGAMTDGDIQMLFQLHRLHDFDLFDDWVNIHRDSTDSY